MIVARISEGGRERWARVEGSEVLTSERPLTLAETAAAGDGMLERSIPLTDVTLLAPTLPDTKILCVGLNYRDHVAETGRELPDHPVIFTRYPDSLVGPGAPIVVPAVSHRLDYEAELAVVIGTGGRAIPAERALDHVLGYTLLNDGSVRDFQRHTAQFTPGKNFEASGSVGPWIVARDAVGALGPQAITLTLGGERLQSSTLDQLIFGVPELIAYVSTFTPLRPGDIIATGTPGGVGSVRQPRRWMTPGEEVVVAIDGVGELRNPIVAEAPGA